MQRALDDGVRDPARAIVGVERSAPARRRRSRTRRSRVAIGDGTSVLTPGPAADGLRSRHESLPRLCLGTRQERDLFSDRRHIVVLLSPANPTLVIADRRAIDALAKIAVALEARARRARPRYFRDVRSGVTGTRKDHRRIHRRAGGCNRYGSMASAARQPCRSGLRPTQPCACTRSHEDGWSHGAFVGSIRGARRA